jgi:hypothetical protein
LDGLSKVIEGLPGTEQVKQRRRVCQMAAWAKLARDEAQAIVAQLLDAAKEATGFNKDAFNASMEDEIRRIRTEESSKKPDGTTRVPKIWPEPLVHSEVLDAVLGEFLDPIWWSSAKRRRSFAQSIRSLHISPTISMTGSIFFMSPREPKRAAKRSCWDSSLSFPTGRIFQKPLVCIGLLCT